MTVLLIEHLSPNCNRRRGTAQAIALHWTAGTFASSLDWICHEESKVSYNCLIAPQGQAYLVVPWHGRAWSMGYCIPSQPTRLKYTDANSAFESIALAGGPPTLPTPQMVETCIALCVDRFVAHGWPASEVSWRITTHQAEAVFGPGHPRAGQRGRKEDPEGVDAKGHPLPAAQKWLDVDRVRAEVARRLLAARTR